MVKKKARSDRKFNRRQAVKLLSIGFSQKDVADLLGVHKTTIGKFVNDNGIATVDNTISIGRHLQEKLTADQLTYLYTVVNQHKNIIDYLADLVAQDMLEPIPTGSRE